MDTELKAKWATALRSDKYQQCTGVLRAEGKNGAASYCCLGVLCDVFGVRWQDNLPYLKDGRRLDDEDGALLGSYMLRVAGFNNDVQSDLAEMNDNGSRFPEIADYIEKNL